jgi:hypothetical protein
VWAREEVRSSTRPASSSSSSAPPPPSSSSPSSSSSSSVTPSCGGVNGEGSLAGVGAAELNGLELRSPKPKPSLAAAFYQNTILVLVSRCCDIPDGTLAHRERIESRGRNGCFGRSCLFLFFLLSFHPRLLFRQFLRIFFVVSHRSPGPDTAGLWGTVSESACSRTRGAMGESNNKLSSLLGWWPNRELACHPSSGTLALSNPTRITPDHKDCPVRDTTIEPAALQATRNFCNARNRMVVVISRGMTDA